MDLPAGVALVCLALCGHSSSAVAQAIIPLPVTTSAAKCGAAVPFTTYEAEAATNKVKGSAVKMTAPPSSTDSTPELEASGRGYVELKNQGDFVEFPNVRAANTILLRHCIPDAPGGGGTTATLSLYVNGAFRQALKLSSMHNWLYGAPGQNGQANEPSAGQPHVFWDETAFWVDKGGWKQGDTIRLQKDAADTAAYYRVDLVDLETAPPPLPPPAAGTYLSVTDFGAKANDEEDDAAAIQACIDAAKAQNKSVWIPAGTYHQKKKFVLDGVTVRGAGMWHTLLIGDELGTTWSGNIGFDLKGASSKVADLRVDSSVHTKRISGGGPITGKAAQWLVENIWIAHTNTGVWIGGSNGTLRNCRVRSTYADAINLNSGASNNTIENNHVRGCGDDGLAILSETEHNKPMSTNNTLRFNTVSAIWWGHNCDLAGGTGHVIEDNILADNAKFGCFTINLPAAYPMFPLSGSTVRRNLIIRGGGNAHGQKRGAVWIFPGSTTIDGVLFQANHIIDPVFRGIHLAGAASQGITFEGNTIDRPGESGVFIESKATGAAIFSSNVVQGLTKQAVPYSNSAGPEFKVTLSKNSWR
jgi:hypothetical protein